MKKMFGSDLGGGASRKKTRKLGKWVNGMDGSTTTSYKAKRKNAKKLAKKSRQRNRK